ncbi:hypothetical protein IFR05_000206 [Cadophora sp. M221]|nr:hypothetical protein IFR05_000206 [Cadophora sp. M221]
MVKEEEKPQRIPSWVDTQTPSRPPATPSKTPSRTPSGSLPGPDVAFQQHQTNAMTWGDAAQYQQQMIPFFQHTMYMNPGSFMMDQFSAHANMQRAAFMRVSADAARGIAVPPMHQWGHLNPNFDFGELQVGHCAEMENENDGEVEGGSALDEADAFLDKISEDLLHEKKRSRDLPVAAAKPISLTPKQSLLAQKKAMASPNPISIPTGPRPRPPSAPRLMRLRNGWDISQEETVLLRENTKPPQPQSAKQASGHENHQGRGVLPVIPPKRIKNVGVAEEKLGTKLPLKPTLVDMSGSCHRGTGEITGIDSGRNIPRDNSKMHVKDNLNEASKEPPSGPRGTHKAVGQNSQNPPNPEARQQSMVVSSTTQEVPSSSHASTSLASQLGSISIPANHPNPFFTIDFHEPSKQVNKQRENHERLLANRHGLDFNKIIEYENNGIQSKDKRELPDIRGLEKSKMLEKMGDDHWRDRVELEKKQVEKEKEDGRAGCVEFMKMLKIGGMVDIEEVRRRKGLRGVTAGVRLVLTQGGTEQTDGKGRDEDILVEGSIVQRGREVSSGAGGLDVSTPGAPGMECRVDPRNAVHHTLLLISALRCRHKREWRWLDENTTAQERAEVARRHRDEWDEWHAALPLREAVSRRGGEEKGTQGHGGGGRSRGVVGERRDVNTPERGGYRDKGRSDGRGDPSSYVRPVQISCSALYKRHAHEMASLNPSTTEQEKRDILRRQEGQLVEWHEAEMLKRQMTHDGGLEQGPRVTPAKGKRKAVDDAEGGVRRKIGRTNEFIAVDAEVPVASPEASTIKPLPNVAVGCSHTHIASHDKGVTSARSPDTTKDPVTGGIDTKESLSESLSERAEKTLINEFDKIFKPVGGSGIVSQDGALSDSNLGTKELDTPIQMQATDPVEIPGSVETPLAIQIPSQAIQSSQTSKGAQTPSVASETQSPQTQQAAEPADSSPPIAQGAWILDSFLGSLAVAPADVPEASEVSKPSSPTRFKRMSCVVS